MENKITLQGLINEMHREAYDAGYNEGYGHALGDTADLLEAAKSAEALLTAMSAHRDEKAVIEERDILRRAIARAEGGAQ